VDGAAEHRVRVWRGEGPQVSGRERESEAAMAKAKRGSWIVTMKCVVTKVVTCDDCTERQAEENPWDYASDERETGQEDWDVLSVEPNE
jgi:hypothetical protein